MKNQLRTAHRGRAAFRSAAMLLVAASALSLMGSPNPARAETREKWCKGVHLRFFVGGAEGDAFGTIVYNGAKQAERDFGPRIDYIFSGWDVEKMVQQLREAIAAKPDGVAMMGHPGDAAIMPLAEEAARGGIKMMYQNVPVPKVIARFGWRVCRPTSCAIWACAGRRGGQAGGTEARRYRAHARPVRKREPRRA
jgi:simple sugar transport system substrate-binding protein